MLNFEQDLKWPFTTSIELAIQYQKEMSANVITEDDFAPLKIVGGMDVSNNLWDPLKQIYASIVLLDWKSMTVTEKSAIARRQDFPYVPGLLGFRESPALIEAYRQLTHKPDLIFVDGHGICHPRKLGIASHIGVLLDCPTIGVGKTILVGRAQGELGSQVGDWVPLVWHNETIGAVVRTKKNCNPLIISTGHRVSLPTAIEFVLESGRGYRLPEPTRQAHLAANACRIDSLAKN